SDPTADVEGFDAVRKMVILGRLAFSAPIEFSDVDVSGISAISLDDLQYGNQLGYTMKLIGIAKKQHGMIELRVQPTYISKKHPLAGVKNEYNAVFIKGESVGETMFYGPGAGSLPTATAILSDVVEVIRNIRLGVNGYRYLAPGQSK